MGEESTALTSTAGGELFLNSRLGFRNRKKLSGPPFVGWLGLGVGRGLGVCFSLSESVTFLPTVSLLIWLTVDELSKFPELVNLFDLLKSGLSRKDFNFRLGKMLSVVDFPFV